MLTFVLVSGLAAHRPRRRRHSTHHPPRRRTRAGARRHGWSLLLAYDSDSAGQDATARAADLLSGLDARVAELPTGLDPADVLVATGPADCAAPWP